MLLRMAKISSMGQWTVSQIEVPNKRQRGRYMIPICAENILEKKQLLPKEIGVATKLLNSLSVGIITNIDDEEWRVKLMIERREVIKQILGRMKEDVNRLEKELETIDKEVGPTPTPEIQPDPAPTPEATEEKPKRKRAAKKEKVEEVKEEIIEEPVEEKTEAVEAIPNYEEMSVPTLRRLITEKGMKPVSRNKQELINQLLGA